jgi:hypothetical protein
MTFLSDAELECLLLSFDIDESELHAGDDSGDYSGNNSDDVDDCAMDVPYAPDKSLMKWLRERDQERNQELNEHFRAVFESSDTDQRRVSPINPYMLTMVPSSWFRPIEFGQW